MDSATAAGVSSTTFTFDSLGRYLRSTQTTFGTAFAFGDTATPGYQWNLADALLVLKAPSGRLFTWSVTPANRPQYVYGNGFNYANVTSFTPDGAEAGLSLAPGVSQTIARNSRGQITSIAAQSGGTNLLTITNEYSATQNNGNLQYQTIQPLNMRQGFTYDSRNRLESAQEQPVGGGMVANVRLRRFRKHVGLCANWTSPRRRHAA